MGICVYVLLRRKKPLHWLLLVSALTMYSIATADIGYTYYLLFAKLLKDGISFTDLRPKYWLYVTNKYVLRSLFDSVLLIEPAISVSSRIRYSFTGVTWYGTPRNASS